MHARQYIFVFREREGERESVCVCVCDAIFDYIHINTNTYVHSCIHSPILTINRLTGSLTQTRQLCERLGSDSETIDLANESEYGDIHTITGVLKQYVREIPGTFIAGLYPLFIAAASRPQSERAPALRDVVRKLPHENRETLRILITHLARVAEHSATNKVRVCAKEGYILFE